MEEIERNEGIDTREETSIYFNNIIRRDVIPIRFDELSAATVDEFSRQVRIAFPQEGDQAVSRVKYLMPYILQNIDWEIYAIPLESWQIGYYYQRERFLNRTKLDYDRFIQHEPMQEAITALGLEPEGVFEFILFLKYYYGLRSELRYSCSEQFDALMEGLNERSEADVTMDVNVGGKHFKISNGAFLRRMFESVNRERLSDYKFINDFDQGSARDKIRALDYYMVKTLLDYLPISHSVARKGRYTQAERNFGLSVLSVCGRLPDVDREGECSQENNATFDKLMRDFAGTRIPFAMELFL